MREDEELDLGSVMEAAVLVNKKRSLKEIMKAATSKGTSSTTTTNTGVTVVDDRQSSSEAEKLGKRQAGEISALRQELNELLKKHDGLAHEFKAYKKSCDERFNKLTMQEQHKMTAKETSVVDVK